MKYFSKIYQLKGLKPKNKDHRNIYECCDLTKKVYLTYLFLLNLELTRYNNDFFSPIIFNYLPDSYIDPERANFGLCLLLEEIWLQSKESNRRQLQIWILIGCCNFFCRSLDLWRQNIGLALARLKMWYTKLAQIPWKNYWCNRALDLDPNQVESKYKSQTADSSKYIQ